MTVSRRLPPRGTLRLPTKHISSAFNDMIDLAARYGIVVFLNPIETGGWLSVLQANGATKAFNYGAYLGNRYKNFGNIVWMSGNDFQSWHSASDDALVQAVALGIRSADSNHIQTIELNYNLSNSLDDSGWAPIVSLNAAYTYYPTYAEVLQAYNAAIMPVFLVEANYEGEQLVADYGGPLTIRLQAYWTMLSGAAGQLFGNHYIWQFSSGWQANLDTPGALDMRHLGDLFAPLHWYDLIPDQNHSVVIAGYGDYATTGALQDSNYTTAARTSDGSLIVAYLPKPTTLTVDMTKLRGPAQARWFDPASGASTSIPGILANTGSSQFTPPGANSAGDPDWVLVLNAN